MILVLNCGSQSLKWKLFDDNLKVIKEDNIKILKEDLYEKTLRIELERLKDFEKEIKIIGHRVVHNGGFFKKPTLIDSKNLKILKSFNNFASLHNPFNILAIETAISIFSKATQIAVFDTQFYSDIPPKAYIYSLPEYLRKKYGFRRFGFHGISHEYASKEAAGIIKKPFNSLKIISCHLGGGVSITAIKNGKAIDTSMGFTPLEGPSMATRCGSIDPGIITILCRDFPISEVERILNKESGLKGICDESEMIKILKRVKKKDKKAKLALDIYVYQIKKYISAYFGILGGCDILVFTGTIGFNSSKIRNMICKNLVFLKNTRVLAIKPDEELAIAKKLKLLNNKINKI